MERNTSGEEVWASSSGASYHYATRAPTCEYNTSDITKVLLCLPMKGLVVLVTTEPQGSAEMNMTKPACQTKLWVGYSTVAFSKCVYRQYREKIRKCQIRIKRVRTPSETEGYWPSLTRRYPLKPHVGITADRNDHRSYFFNLLYHPLYPCSCSYFFPSPCPGD